MVRETGTFEQPARLNIDAELVESWASTAANKRLYLATVQGDTLAGEAVINISEFSLGSNGFRLERSHKHMLNDVHVTEPRFLDGNRGVEILLMNWIDEESTIARYLGSPAGPNKPLYSGIFPKGTRIIASFSHEESDVLIARFRTGNQWNFQLCHL